ncbi:bifunctional diaminohydroxyphosphoribosylaminopyrimidine deaminase/5-amino-6-(5-phosphoribosylamino)uracil reductase RibD [Coralloluteibacterium stylophorae]|uniref:Riboflavin biosynthesis protein RibD n=2 Tax=Coralloluteibacterium stylophorae TaxID=1776034 RepID=A0AAP2CCK7_9GAMM|nr:bifunctional diaminohydroxyphosphoribosylaminopyrimidine deaminase/5-amino-6-(5-phosphoribosylamino)uracil reductase RibD [Coralloluteibacterium stylophorae]MBS7457761.1 bifunctional diaminohydroxyphosphoribosylaminopyrimidine deaminase/5-amino-6-(5-phosphoribosylamino)uracil reductase RibD [Coralloluteibacterium stylophorae]
MPTASPFDATEHALMAEALRLAARGAYSTRPNPMVGCVIARDGEVVGRGWHRRAGEPHAEVHALREAGEAARGATAYVTLEPCSLHGRTPPCSEALVAAGVRRVVMATGDPFQEAGHGIERMRAAGLEVDAGLLQAEARALNRGFFARVERGRPWLRVKLAMSLDGRTALASGESKWITGPAARTDVQRWRARAGALVTGVGTVIADDPRLTARLPQEEIDEGGLAAPVRVVLDSRGRTPAGAAVLNDAAAPTWLLQGEDVPDRHGGARVEHIAVPCDDGRVGLEAALALLARRGINEVQVESGPTLAGALLRAGLVDEVLLYVAPLLLGERGRPLFGGITPETMAGRIGLETVETRQVGTDLRLLLRPRGA